MTRALSPGFTVPVSNRRLVFVGVCEIWSWLLTVTRLPVKAGTAG
jgi:hypothetical protein